MKKARSEPCVLETEIAPAFAAGLEARARRGDGFDLVGRDVHQQRHFVRAGNLVSLECFRCDHGASRCVAFGFVVIEVNTKFFGQVLETVRQHAVESAARELDGAGVRIIVERQLVMLQQIAQHVDVEVRVVGYDQIVFEIIADVGPQQIERRHAVHVAGGDAVDAGVVDVEIHVRRLDEPRMAFHHFVIAHHGKSQFACARRRRIRRLKIYRYKIHELYKSTKISPNVQLFYSALDTAKSGERRLRFLRFDTVKVAVHGNSANLDVKLLLKMKRLCSGLP